MSFYNIIKLVKLPKLLSPWKLFNFAKNKNYNVLFSESVYVQINDNTNYGPHMRERTIALDPSSISKGVR